MRNESRSFLMRLLRDRRAATLPLMAAATVPLAGMVGGALDMSRLYLVKTRLQQACDAGALAARRSMANDTLDANSQEQGQRFFRANLRSNDYGAENVALVLSPVLDGAKATGRVAGSATAQVEPAIMQLFGFRTFNLTATCEAELNLTNTDVMFVLDLTGSMACLPSDSTSTCTAYGNSKDASGNPIRRLDATTGRPYTVLKTGSRLQGLKDAVTAFHATLDDAVPDGIRLRFGFVPYSSNVNMWAALPTTARATGRREYQSRIANMKTPIWRPTTSKWSDYTEQTYGSPTNISWTNCEKYQANQSFSQNGNNFNPDPAGNTGTSAVRATSKPADVMAKEYSAVTASYGGNRNCKRRYRTGPTSYSRLGYGFTHWTYQKEEYDLSSTTMALVESLSTSSVTEYTTTSDSWNSRELAQKVAAGTAFGMTTTTRSTDGCVEERNTGMDDIDDPATDDDTRWAPTWRWLTYLRDAAAREIETTEDHSRPNPGLAYNCTKSAQRLRTMTATDVTNFLNDPAFVAMGYTYHDIGMYWGARLMAASGVFSADHAQADNGRPTARHIIFMTDGDMDPDLGIYSPYGVERLSTRRLGLAALTDNNLKSAHNAAFLRACAAARADGITVWVVAFGQALTPELIQCAGDETRDFESTNTATLTSQFQNIASRIAELRLSQ